MTAVRTALATLLVGFSCVSEAGYEVVALKQYKTAEGLEVFQPKRINNNGEIIGEGTLPGMPLLRHRAFRLRDGKMEQLELLPGGEKDMFGSSANGINDAGVIVGNVIRGKVYIPAIWEPGKPLRVLDVPVFDYSAADAISNSGLIAGHFQPQKYNMAFMMRQGELTELGTLGSSDKGISASYPVGVNDNGQVIGSSTHPGGIRAFFWEGGRMRELPPLPEHEGPDSNVLALAINNAGQIVGCSGSKSWQGFAPVMWNPNGSVISLGVPERNKYGARQGCAHGINSKGQVVGQTSTAKGDFAFIWDAKSGLRLLDDLADAWDANLDRFSDAVAINDRGEIIGMALGPKEEIAIEPYLLRPTDSWRFGKRRLLYGGGLGGALLAATGLALWLRNRSKKDRA